MPKFTVICKSGDKYSTEADYAITATETCDTVSFVNKPTDDYSISKVIAQFKLESISGFYNEHFGKKLEDKHNEE
ncbi:MAG: hypothetical protein J6W76_01440 [Spirochaetales bacterium]|nr:hypothetical protein [Spirochaetales bacterium]